MWTPPRTWSADCPSCAKAIQYQHPDFGAEYLEYGLEVLIRRKRESEVEKYLTGFANRIAEVIMSRRLDTSALNPDITATASAFHDHDNAEAGQGSQPSQRRRHVEFLIVAANSTQMRRVRQGLDSYGSVPQDLEAVLPR